MFSVGPDIFTVYQNGAMLSTNPLANGTFNTATGAFTLVDPSQLAATPIYWYPALPVMGITQYQVGAINNQPSYAFDTEFAYLYSGGAWARSGNAIWHGTNLNFFNVANWTGITPDIVTMYVTNFNATVPAPGANDDPMWYTSDGFTWIPIIGVNGFYFAPNGGAPYTGPFIQTCRLIIPFKNRLVLLNTIENNGAGVNKAYPNRARFCFNGSPLAVNAWYEPDEQDNAGNTGAGGDYLDAATEEQIISAQFIKDRLIVFFERSTWEIAYTGNDLQPFLWQKINTELGSEAQNSSVPFDKEILTVGNTGVHACNGANVARIDQKIPDEIFDLKNKNLGVQRVCGIRDYFTECVYWAFPASFTDDSFVYPNRVLQYNYQNNTWAVLDDVITAFGYWQQDRGVTWASSQTTWEESNFEWNSGELQQQFRDIIAGDQQGFMFIVRPDDSRNAMSMQITNISNIAGSLIVTVIDHTLSTGDFILIENVAGSTGLNGNIYKVGLILSTSTFRIEEDNYAGTYSGGGTITRVSNIDILSKQWNPYDKNARNVYIAKIDFAVQNTLVGEVTVDYYPSSTELSTLEFAEPGVLTGTGVLETGPYPIQFYPLEQIQERLWHTIYLQTSGTAIQIEIFMSDDQMLDPLIALADFELEGLILYTQPVDNRLQ
jgi:hypothetical protein